MSIRHAGLALIVGVVLGFVAPLFMPGYTLIDPVDQIDFPVAVEALGDAPILAQWMNYFTLISLLLMIFGLLALYPLASRQAGLSGKILQFGIVATIIEWSIFIVATGMRHFEIHLLQRSTLDMGGSLSSADFVAAALSMHMDITAVMMGFAALAPIASGMVGIGLAARFASMNLFKAASYILVIGAIVGLANFLFAMSSPELGIRFLLLVSILVLYVQGICLIIIGYGMHKGQAELTEES